MTESEVESTLPSVEKPLGQYMWLQSRFSELNNPEEDEEFRRKYCVYYRIFAARRSSEWQGQYFGLFSSFRGEAVEYEGCLTKLRDLTGKLEASFASKMLATIQPDNVVLDKLLLEYFGLQTPRYGRDRLKRTVAVYQTLAEKLGTFCRSSDGMRLIEQFRRYNETFKNADVTDIKICDLTIWTFCKLRRAGKIG